MSDLQTVSRVSVFAFFRIFFTSAIAAQVDRCRFVMSSSVSIVESKYLKLGGLNCSEAKIFPSVLRRFLVKPARAVFFEYSYIYWSTFSRSWPICGISSAYCWKGSVIRKLNPWASVVMIAFFSGYEDSC